MEIHSIKTVREYENALKEISTLLNCKENTAAAERLEILSILVENYEEKYHRMEVPDPISAINFRLEQLGLSRRDLEKSIGSKSRVSEIMNRKRQLTLPMIRKLHKNLNIPAEILIQEPNRKSA